MARSSAAEALKPPTPPAPPKEVKTAPARSGATVTVACKMPTGLRLTLFKARAEKFPVAGGMMIEETISRPAGDPVVLHGNRVPFGERAKVPVVGGYGLNHGISKDFWDAWVEQNKNLDIVRNRIVFAYDTPDHARGAAKEQRDVLSGLEPLNMGRKTITVRGATKSVPVDDRLVSLSRIKENSKTDEDVDDE